MKRDPGTMLVAGVVSLVIGALFLFLPWRSEQPVRHWVGAIWIATGMIWFLAWRWTSMVRPQ